MRFATPLSLGAAIAVYAAGAPLLAQQKTTPAPAPAADDLALLELRQKPLGGIEGQHLRFHQLSHLQHILGILDALFGGFQKTFADFDFTRALLQFLAPRLQPFRQKDTPPYASTPVIDMVETHWPRDRDSRIVQRENFGAMTSRLWKTLREESMKTMGRMGAAT